jgi:2-polyprenyl-3-methyl-5-hydroxy-6-metoxy-1,4-benzoquinol methylase
VRFKKFALLIHACTGCHHQFAVPPNVSSHVGGVYGDEYFFGGGAGYEDYLAEANLLISRGEQYAELLARYAQPGRVLDVGSAAGFLLRGLVNRGWQGVGVEPNLKLANYAREVMQVDSHCGAFEDFPGDETFKAVTMIQVISHLIDPQSAVIKARNLLQPGGLLLIETWDRGSWAAKLLGQRWHEYSPPSVLHWFTREGLARLLRAVDMEIVASGRPKRSIQVGHAKSLIRYKYGQLAATTLFWLPSSLRLPYLADDLMWIVARKGD